jgi:MFS superfamily sulfate permease-like transporter
VTRYLPILGWLPRYERRSLPADALAGLSVWALLVPQSLAYATLAGVPVRYGLYTAFAALLMYPIFGTSRQLAEGPSAAVCAVVAATITPLVGAAALGTGAAAPYAAGLALATGVVYVVLGLLRMGWVSTFLSKAVMAGRRLVARRPQGDRDRRRPHRPLHGRHPGRAVERHRQAAARSARRDLRRVLGVARAARAMATKHGVRDRPEPGAHRPGRGVRRVRAHRRFAVDGSLSKSSVADAAGQQTQMASLINAVFILLTLLFLASIFENLSTATLGAVVIDALVGLLTLTRLRRYLNTSRADFVFFAAAMLGILAVGIIAGLLIGGA